MPVAYPLNLRTIIRASKRRNQAASFAVANPMRGYGWAQATGRDNPQQWDVTFRFTTDEARVFRAWFVADLDQGIKPFTMPIRTESGTVEYTCRFMPQGLLPAREIGEVWEYTATIVARGEQYGTVEPSLWRLAVTVPASSVTAALDGFPLWISLDSMPSDFWDALAFEDGRDLRVKTAAGADIPFDLVNIRPVERRGSLFVRQSLNNTAPSTVYLHFGPASASEFVAPSDANGRHAVWADYHRVYTLGPTPFDRTSGGAYPTQLTALGFGLERVSDSPNLGVHQGVAFDGTYYYVSDTNGLKKYTQSWTLVAQNTNPCGDVGGGVNHVGDIHVEGAILYAPVEFYSPPSPVAFQKIAKFRASDLAFISATDISAQGHECSSVSINPRDGLLYVSSFNDGSKLWKYKPSTLAYVGSLSLSSSIAQIQGIAFWRDAIWISEDANDTIRRVELDGTVRNGVWGLGPGSPGNWEGLCARPDGLSALYDPTGAGDGFVLRLEHRDIAAAAGSRFFTTGVLEAAATRYTTWTIGASVILDNKTANRAILSYATSGTTDATKRTTLAYRQVSDRIGYWNSVDTWLLDTVSPTVGQNYRYNVKQNGTTDRKLYRNGSLVATDSGVVSAPPTGSNEIVIGAADSGGTNEIMDGKIGFVYLRSGLLSDSWLAAESANLISPSTFYTVGTREVLA